MKKLLFSISLLLFSLNIFAQYVDNGQDPSSLKWKQIDTKNFKFIYTEDSEVLAQRFAKLFTDLWNKEYSSLNHKARKIPIILHSHGAISNGVVLWAPRRMELFASSEQHTDFVSFTEHLGVHEYRHVIQIDKMNQSLTKFGSYIFGEQATIGVIGIYVPMWFLEGDAVAFETGNTKGGRGRLPSFEQELRAQLVEKGAYTYDKAVFGSFNDFTPNRYNLGYYMIANARKHYGTQIWENTINEMARNPWNIYCFEVGMRKGFMSKRDSVWRDLAKEYKRYDSKFLNVDSLLRENKHSDPKLTLYSDNMSELSSKWLYEDKLLKLDEAVFLNKKNKLYASYMYPQRTEDGSIIAFKNDLNDIDAIVELNSQKEEKVLAYPTSSIRDLDYNKDILVWSEYDPDLRWENGGRTVVVKFNIKTKELKRYSSKHNLYNPCLSKNGQIAIISEDNICQTSLELFKEGKFINILSSTGEEEIQMPTWVGENELAYIVLNEIGKRIDIINIHSKETRQLTQSEEADIANLEYSNGKIYYSSSYSGKDEICSVEISTGKKNIQTQARFGNRYVDIKENNLLYSTYTSDGYQIMESKPLEKSYGEKAIYELAEVLKEQERPELLVKDSLPRVFKTKNYSKATHLFKVHSWAPLFVNGFDRTIEGFADLGVSIASQNDLSTMFMVAGLRRDKRYNSGTAFLQMKYKALWPKFDIKADVGTVRFNLVQNFNLPIKDNKVIPGILDIEATRVRTNVSGKMSLPFNISEGAYFSGIEPYFKYEYINISKAVFEKAIFKSNMYNVDLSKELIVPSMDISVFSYNLLFYNLRKLSLRDFDPKWGQIFEAGYINSPLGDRDFGRSIYAITKLFTPGLFTNHSLSLYAAHQHYSIAASSQSIRNIDIARGIYINSEYKDLTTLKANYTLPLLYPDLSLGGFIYTKRLYSSLFYETSIVNKDHNYSFYSTGIDLRANIHILRFKTPVDLGVRAGYESKTRSTFFEFLFNLSFDI